MNCCVCFPAIIGLGREKTRLQITREKTKIRREDIAKDKRKKSLSRFQSAANQLKTMKTFDRPMSKEEEMFMGNVGIEVPSTAKVVRIFTSSTFTGKDHQCRKFCTIWYDVCCNISMSHIMRKPVCHMRTKKAQISLRIRAV